MEDNTLYSIIWTCIASICLSLVGAVLYYNLEKPSLNELVIQLVNEHNMNPMIGECIDRQWNTVDVFEICQIVAGNPYITKEEIKERFEMPKE